MEKQRNKAARKSCKRLLGFIAFIFCTFPSFSQTLTASIIKELTIVPTAEQKMYAKEDLKFEVFLPYVKSNQVQIQSPSLAANVTFKQIKKYDDYVNGGVKLEIWYNFEKKGEYQLPPLSLTIQNRKRTIKFAPVTINDNPADMSPRIVIEFANGTIIYSDQNSGEMVLPVGEAMDFTVYLQYAVQLIQFTYDIPKDSIFTQAKVFEITEIKYREKKYSDELIPVATFEWTGLVKGKQVMPSLRLQVTGYNGYRTDIVMPEFTVEFVADEENTAESDFAIQTYEDAFDFSFDEAENQKKFKITEETCTRLAQLRIEERNEIIGHMAKRQERQDFEEELGLPATENEFFIGIFYFAHILLIVLILFLIHFIRKHRINATIFFAALTICSIAFFTFAKVKQSDQYAIFTGGKVSSIPEAKAESFSEITAGNRVHIIEKAGQWYYIELGETGGWCQTDKLIIIR